jgi:hypothetical protein
VLTSPKAGLFSAIITAFIIEVYKGLQQDNSAMTIHLLRRISMQLDDTKDQQVALSNTFTPSATIVAVNVLWFCGLILSLFAALFGILAKQWLHAYSKWSERALPKDTLLLRDFYQEGFILWRVPEIIGILPALLQVALLLFVVGLIVYLWTLNVAVATVLSALVAGMISLAGLTVILPVIYEDCPYKSPLGLLFAALRPGRRFSSWQARDASRPERCPDPLAMLSSILDIHPRSLLLEELQKGFSDGTLIESRTSILLETVQPGILAKVFAEFTEGRNVTHDQYPLRDLHTLERISRVTNEADSAKLAITTMNVFKKLSKFPRHSSECLPVIIRTIHRRMKDCKPCSYIHHCNVNYLLTSKKVLQRTCLHRSASAIYGKIGLIQVDHSLSLQTHLRCTSG